jgi:hypothetical protein
MTLIHMMRKKQWPHLLLLLHADQAKYHGRRYLS